MNKLNSLKFSREPIAWIGTIIIAALLIQDYMTTGITVDSWDAAFVAAGTILGREFVSPVDKE